MIGRIFAGIASRTRALLLRARGAHLTGHVLLRAIEVPRQPHRLALDAGAALDRGVALIISGDPTAPVAIHIGRNVYINRDTIIDASESVEIGDDCMIGPFCYLTDHDHSPGADGTPAGGPLVSRPLTLESCVWIGAHVTVLKGVRIGRGAVVGAGSVVTRDVAPGSIVVGNPARPLPGRSGMEA